MEPSNVYRKLFGERICALRGDVSRDAFGRQVGADRGEIADWEEGSRVISARKLAQVLERGDVPVRDWSDWKQLREVCEDEARIEAEQGFHVAALHRRIAFELKCEPLVEAGPRLIWSEQPSDLAREEFGRIRHIASAGMKRLAYDAISAMWQQLHQCGHMPGVACEAGLIVGENLRALNRPKDSVKVLQEVHRHAVRHRLVELAYDSHHAEMLSAYSTQSYTAEQITEYVTRLKQWSSQIWRPGVPRDCPRLSRSRVEIARDELGFAINDVLQGIGSRDLLRYLYEPFLAARAAVTEPYFVSMHASRAADALLALGKPDEAAAELQNSFDTLPVMALTERVRRATPQAWLALLRGDLETAFGIIDGRIDECTRTPLPDHCRRLKQTRQWMLSFVERGSGW